jgi:hypothetical protein
VTSSSVAVRRGSQQPSDSLVPAGTGFHGEDASLLAAGYGLDLDPWQRLVLSAWMLEDRSGRWAASTCGLSVPRQNGKNSIIEVRQLYGMVEFGEKFLHTAHEVKTARKAFARLLEFFDNRDLPHLAEMVRDIRRTNGQEAILLWNGGSVEFVARSKGSGRGYTVDTLVCDEAQHMTDNELEALKSTISAAPSGRSQTIYTGTPPNPDDAAEVFPRVRRSALEDGARRLSWHEWSCGKDADLDDMEVWYETNPGLGIRLHPDTVQDERVDLSDDGFLRERLGSWQSSASFAVIDPDRWLELADPDSKPARSRVAFAVDVAPDRKTAAVAVAGDRQDGRRHVELVDHRSGTGWVVERVVELVGRWGGTVGLDPSSPAGSLLTDFMQAKLEPALVGTREMTQACGAFFDMVVDGSVAHLGQPKLNVAVDAGRKRTVGDAWAWHRRDASSDISPLVAVTLASHVLGKPSGRREVSGDAEFF